MKTVNFIWNIVEDNGSTIKENNESEACMRLRYELQVQVPNTYVRHELRKNMTNLPMRWKGVALASDIDALFKNMPKGARIEDREEGVFFYR